ELKCSRCSCRVAARRQREGEPTYCPSCWEQLEAEKEGLAAAKVRASGGSVTQWAIFIFATLGVAAVVAVGGLVTSRWAQPDPFADFHAAPPGLTGEEEHLWELLDGCLRKQKRHQDDSADWLGGSSQKILDITEWEILSIQIAPRPPFTSPSDA